MVFLTRHEEFIKVRPWLAFQLTFEHLFELLLLLPLPKAFWVFWFPNLALSQKTKVCYIFSFSSPFAKKNSPRTNRLNSFRVSFSLFQKNEGLTAWILLCLPSPFSKNSKWHSLRILLILPFPLNKRFQRTNRLRYLLFPLHKVSKD